MKPYCANGKFLETCLKVQRPDDLTVGLIAEGILKVPLTVIDEFHSHKEPLKTRIHNLNNEISLSYQTASDNVLPVGGFNLTVDPTRYHKNLALFQLTF